MGKDLNGKELGIGLSQRKDGRYEARAIVKGQKIDLYSSNLRDLKKQFNEAKEQIIREDVVERKDVTLSEWFEEWFEVCKKPQLKNTAAVRGYRRKFVNRYGAIIGNSKLKDIRQIHVQRATNEMLDKGMNARNIGDALSVLRQCCDTALANRMIFSNPCNGVILPNDKVVSERRVLEHWEQDLLLEAVKGRYYEEVYHICLLTGMRIGEIGGLMWGDIDFDKKVINVQRSLSVSYDKGKVVELGSTKTVNSIREIPFFGDVESKLISWRKKQDETKRKLGKMWRNTEYGDLVFTTSRGSPLTKYALQQDIKQIVKCMNAMEAYNATKEGRTPRAVESIYPHAFRHTFATRCFEKDMAPIFVQRVMGHINYSTTVSYTHVVECVREREIEKAKKFLETDSKSADASRSVLGCVKTQVASNSF